MCELMVLTAEQIYDRLINEDKIKSLNGYIKFNLGKYSMVVKNNDSVGSIIEEWVREWLRQNNIYYRPNPLESKPDVFLFPDSESEGLLEIKSYYSKNGPGYDIADFTGFAKELIHKPYLLNVDVLIFAYSMDIETGEIRVVDAWLRKVWELSRPHYQWPINVQYKNKTITKIRPANLGASRTKYKCFECLEDYLSAFEETLFAYQPTHAMASEWKFRFQRSYKNYYKQDIEFPRWADIKSKYMS